MLILSDITSKFRTVAIFVIIFHTQWEGTLMTYFRTKFRVPSSNISLVITFKPNSKENVSMVAMLLFYIILKLP
jgi:hypothetical protein